MSGEVHGALLHDVTVVCDLDGTLVDTAPDLIAAANHTYALRGLSPVDGMVLRPWVSFGAKRMIVEGLAHSRATFSEREINAMLAEFLAYYGANIARDSRPFPGMVAALDALAAYGARLAVCTNKREVLARLLLETLGLASRFQAITGRDTFAVSKPHPDHLLETIRLAGGDPTRAMMIGDSSVDIATAKAAHIPVIAVTFGYSETPVRELAANAVVDHWDDLVPAVCAVLERPQSHF